MKVLAPPGLSAVGSHKYLLKVSSLSQLLLLIAVEFALISDTHTTAFNVWIKASPTSENQIPLSSIVIVSVITQSYLCYDLNVI